ncbi:uncharacterized protein LOC142095415 [Mixophyes fleayi]|uniref:uncharacterized protein LOC142095415 n=1 Tax=Mixophyes fleayi TaxID=3061075 RepID=UPI003F4D741E
MLKLCVLLLGIFICVTESTIYTSHDAISKQIKKNCDKHSSILSNLPLGNIAVRGLLPRQKNAVLDTDIHGVDFQLQDAASNRHAVVIRAVIRLGTLSQYLGDLKATITFDTAFGVKGGVVSLATDMDTLDVDVTMKSVPRRSQTIPADFKLQIKEKLIAPCKDLMKIVIDTCNEQNKKFKAVYTLGNNLQCRNEITSIVPGPDYIVLELSE